MVDRSSSFMGDRLQHLFDIAAELRDDTFFKLVEDFLGSQNGEKLTFERITCNNRLLVQVGLIKEENQVTWKDVVKWLEVLFPRYQSADFKTLTERSITMALGLSAEERESFLEKSVNFEYVGPLCDSLGIGRTDLLEMSDFSDRVKSAKVTNGLVLELQSFMNKQKIDPSVLVSWLKNFNPQFCSDGKILKASKFLQAKLKKMKLDNRIHQRSRFRRNSFVDKFLLTEFELVPNAHVRATSIKRKKSWGSNRIKKKRFLSRYQSNKMKTGPAQDKIKGHLSCNGEQIKYDMADHSTVFTSNQTSKSGNQKSVRDPPSNGNNWHPEERNPVTTSSVEPLDAGKVETLTLLDVSMLAFQKLLNVYGSETRKCNQVFKELMGKHFDLMAELDSNMNAFNEKVNLCREEQFAVPSPLHFLECSAYFLLELSDSVEEQIMSFEREIATVTGEKLGRDNSPKFMNFVNFSESATSRCVHMACDILSPRGEEKYGCRKEWLDFCLASGKPSKLTTGCSNRFNNYFEGAAGLVHHKSEIDTFFSDAHLSETFDKLNIIQESVRDDLHDQVIQALVCVLAIVYCKVVGPYWQLLKSSAEYFYFHRYAHCLLQKLRQWSLDATPLLAPEYSNNNLFQQFPLQEKCFEGVFSYCKPENQYFPLIRQSLEKIMKTFVAVAEKNLKAFLPGGEYSQDPTPEICAILRPCPLSQLMGKYPFGHGCLDNSRKLNGSNVPPRNTLETQNPSQEIGSLKFFQMPSEEMDPQEREKLLQDIANKNSILAAVMKNGGPCQTKEDVDYLLVNLEGATHAQKREAIRLQISYQKVVLGSKDKCLNKIGFSLKDMVEKLKTVLIGDDNPKISTPTKQQLLSTDDNAGPCKPHHNLTNSSVTLSSSEMTTGGNKNINMSQHQVHSFENYREKIGCFVYLD
ncbi:solute carrier family 52, riboflavin transporter, member 2 isoform X1 [Amia ocellicauda]|uniref:solute carrier family 52, riboflavin transporter, member 2 isoform X1 n=1 Tax=Amia ocellicauda TaxID=2972642 RepID=UPI003463F714